ncbi:TadE/TadG family type IV pilus assembly protein [Halobacteriovorax sp. HLS]|uniref:TadE/TadG family type IV pilus assembly protein n=1 Tax=Halobacteriovorax sp. HLS TaxID=2234000 RepID=UPI000FD9D15C|nr:Tad domain-containing protein [Halobacteriovorax sp. HLS]
MKKVYKDQRGQLSIFLGIIMVIVITMMGFIINVGLFVKAKINLQNAVDAAAWSGAAVQARQMTNIAYLNWEMRNTYKEWMFKYYVIGQLGLGSQLDPAVTASQSNTNFRLVPFPGSNEFDPYNLPSTCMSFGGSKDICKLFSTPGLPRFEAPGLLGIDEQHQSFENVITEIKASNCSKKSIRNFGSAMIWAYGIKKDFFTDTPSAAGHRTGAWIQAIELGLRMRNLEAIVNRPPVDEPICYGASGCTSYGQLAGDNAGGPFGNPYNERPIKAFRSAFRNLSGGANKSGQIRDEFASSFKLTELKPKVFNASANSLSTTLMPPNPVVNLGSSSYVPSQKRYIDLIAYPLNLVTFYTTLVTNNSGEAIKSIVGNTPVEGACGATKTGLPVPGYMFGYVKNPKVLTYYAVKGEADFIGLFYPFSENKGVTLQAYASAKPFGGRIGPMLFGLDSEATYLTPRNEASQNRSLPYVSGLLMPGGPFKAGRPIPNTQDFWVDTATSVIGGSPSSGIDVKFAVPNLLYDFDNYSDLSQHTSSPEGAMQAITESATSLVTNPEELGLFDAKQFTKLASHLQITDPSLITADQIEIAIESARRPTRYEALNYMIPTMENSPTDNPENLSAFPAVVIKTPSSPITGNNFYQLFAPLWGTDTLYPTPDSIISVIQNYLTSSDQAVEKYLDALKSVAEDIAATPSTGTDSYRNAANSIYALDAGLSNFTDCDNLSMATRFNQFFKGGATECGIKPLPEMIRDYISSETALGGNTYRYFYTSSYVKPSNSSSYIAPLSNKDMLSAYSPGPRQGSNDDGDLTHPFDVYSSVYSAKRNYYSTKFIPASSISGSGPGTYLEKAIYSEKSKGQVLNHSDDIASWNVVNELESGQLSDFGTLTH